MGQPVIALGSDVDCIPQASQKPGVAYHDPIIEGAPAHGEGHNSGMPLQIAAALAVKKNMEQQQLQGTLILWPGIAEELVGPKAYYVRAGLFKDVDISIFAHVSDNLGVSWVDGNQNGLVSVEYKFQGESAHAAAAPWRGRSALDAVAGMATTLQPRRGREVIPDEEKRGGGSDDIGDISWNVPTVTLRYLSNMAAGPGHNGANAISMAGPIAHKGIQVGAKVVALTVIDFLMQPELTTQAWDYFRNVQTKTTKYTPLIRPGDQPAIWLNEQIMAKYRPEMTQYYYDATKYNNYLEQLGVKYPTLR